MNDHASLSAVEVLVLTRLLPVGEKGETTAKIAKDLEPLLGHRWSGSVLTEALDWTLIRLAAKGLVMVLPVPAKGKGRRKGKPVEPKCVLTAPGRLQALQQIGVESLGAKTTWAVLKKTHLPARALGQRSLSAASLKTLGSDPGFKAALLNSTFELSLDDCPTLAKALDALSWKLIGMDSTEKFTVGAVQKALFHRALGDPAVRPADAKKSVDLLLARKVGARRSEVKEFREAMIRNWIDRSLGLPESKPSLPPAPPFDLHRFADRVLAAARACPTGRYGDSKVFVVHVWRALCDDPEFRGTDFPTFKQRLAEANNARLLDLSRADLVQAMDPQDVQLSEVCYLNARFHFIRTDPERH